MPQWYLSYDGDQMGPLDHAQAVDQCRKNPDGFAWREGFSDWLPIRRIGELASTGGGQPAPPPPA